MPRKPDISANGLSITNEPNPAEPKPEPVASIVEDKGELVLFVESADKLKYSAYIRCDAGIFQITCGKLIEANSKGTFLNIESLASQDGKDSSSELEGMKNMLGLNEKHAVVSITQISQDPITVPKTVEDGNTPNSETTSPGAQPHTTGNDRPVNA